MKKYLLILSFIFFSALASAETAHPKTKSPSFFVPQNAFKTGMEKETLIPVEKMTFNGQPAPSIVTSHQKQNQIKISKPKLIKSSSNLPKQNTAAPRQNNLNKTDTSPTSSTKTPDNNTARNIEDTILQPKLEEISAPKDIFQTIFAEYENDTHLIGTGQPLSNPRLKNILAQFDESIHEL